MDRLIGKNSIEVVSYPTNNFFLCSPLDRNFGVILHRTLRDGYIYDPNILALLRDCTSESTYPRPCFQALQYHLCSVLSIATLLFLLFLLQKSISTIITTLVSPSLRRTSAPIQITIVFSVLGTQETFYYLVAGVV